MIATILTKNEMTKDEIKFLWDQGVDMDDVDYLVFAPVNSVKEFLVDNPNTIRDGCSKISRIEAIDFDLGFLLDRLSVCSGTWYIADFRGEKKAIGVAYHS